MLVKQSERAEIKWVWPAGFATPAAFEVIRPPSRSATWRIDFQSGVVYGRLFPKGIPPKKLFILRIQYVSRYLLFFSSFFVNDPG